MMVLKDGTGISDYMLQCHYGLVEGPNEMTT